MHGVIINRYRRAGSISAKLLTVVWPFNSTALTRKAAGQHAGRLSGIQFLDDIGQKQHLAGRATYRFGYMPIRLRLTFRRWWYRNTPLNSGVRSPASEQPKISCWA